MLVSAVCGKRFLPYFITASIMSLVMVGVAENVCWLGARLGRKLLPSSWKIGCVVVGVVFLVVDLALGAKIIACEKPLWSRLVELVCLALMKVLLLARSCVEIVSCL